MTTQNRSNSPRSTRSLYAAAGAGLVLGAAGAWAAVSGTNAATAAEPATATAPAASVAPIASTELAQPAGADMGRMLIEGLRATPGCLGADAAETMSGRNSIFGWFENREAAMNWYRNPVHRRMMQMAGGGSPEPMKYVPEDVPIMVIATITPSEAPEIEGMPLPIKQISIELFTPLPGGAHINGRLSPKAFKVKHMKDYAEADGAGAAGEHGGASEHGGDGEHGGAGEHGGDGGHGG
ncbi:MAG: hypothetical protein AB8G96_05295 [Phycisphaerales bacterium]